LSLLSANELSLAFGPKVVLDRASFTIGPRDRIGLVGANGTGKSSLMRILAGTAHPDQGDLVFRRGARAG
jgi:ATP-binding cassette, subfamily F, member 3